MSLARSIGWITQSLDHVAVIDAADNSVQSSLLEFPRLRYAPHWQPLKHQYDLLCIRMREEEEKKI